SWLFAFAVVVVAGRDVLAGRDVVMTDGDGVGAGRDVVLIGCDVVLAACAVGTAVSRLQSCGRLSSRSPRNVGCLRPPSSVHSVKRTSATSLGSTQWWPRPVGVPTSNGERSRASGLSRSRMRFSDLASKPVPTLETYTRRSPS